MKKAERLNQELIFLSNKHSFQLKDLINEFQISKRTALRDVEELDRMGLPLYTESGRYGGYHLLTQKLWTPVYFSDEEVEAIFFALNALKLLSSTPFEKSYSQIKQKLLATLPKEQQENLERLLGVVHYYGVAPVVHPAYLSLILRAILEEKVLHMIYHQHGREIIDLQIYELFYRDGIWFCSAYEMNQEKWGTYRCDDMVDCEWAEGFQTYSLEELKDFQERYENNYHNIPFRCRLTEFGRELFLKHHYPNMFLKEVEGVSYLTGGYNASELGYMTHYLCSYGQHLVIEFPENLKVSYLEQLRKMQTLQQ